jgi:hypothetical protein
MVVEKAVIEWNRFGNDWKIGDYSLNVSAEGISMVILSLNNVGHYSRKISSS